MALLDLQLRFDDGAGADWSRIAELLEKWSQRYDIAGDCRSFPDPVTDYWRLTLTSPQSDVLSLVDDLYASLYEQGVNLEIDIA